MIAKVFKIEFYEKLLRMKLRKNVNKKKEDFTIIRE